MNNWSPNGQLASLQFHGVIALVIALQLLYFIVSNTLVTVYPEHAMTSGWLHETLRFIPPALATFFLLRYLLTLRRLYVGTSWGSMLMLLKDEYALSIYRSAASKAFAFSYGLALLLLYFSALTSSSSYLSPFVRADIFLAILLSCSSIVFGLLVLLNLRNEDE